MSLGLAAVCLLAATAAAGTTTAAPRFSRDVMVVFERRCSFCHSRGNNYGGLVLERDVAYAQLVDAPALTAKAARVRRGVPDASYLMMKIDGTHATVGGSGTRMPPGWGALTPVERETVRRWILAGARDD